MVVVFRSVKSRGYLFICKLGLFKRLLAKHCFWVLLLACPVVASAQETVKLQLAWRHQFQFAGYYAALDKGFYRKAGLNVQILEGGPNTDVTEEIKSGRAEFGVGSSSALLSRARGDRIIVLGAVFQYSPSVILVTRQSGIKRVKDLQNRRLMDAPNADDVAAMFKAEGLNYQNIPRVRHNGDPRDLLTGKADAMLAYSGNQAFLLESLGVPCKEFSPRASGIDFYGDNLITTDDEVANNPERTEAFRAASMKGWCVRLYPQRGNRRPDPAPLQQGEEPHHLLYEANQYQTLVQPALVEMGYQSPTRWQAIANDYKALGMLDAAQVPEGLIYKQEVHAAPRWLVPLLLAILALSLVGFGLNIRNNRRSLRLKKEVEERRRAELAIATAGMKPKPCTASCWPCPSPAAGDVSNGIGRTVCALQVPSAAAPKNCWEFPMPSCAPRPQSLASRPSRRRRMLTHARLDTNPREVPVRPTGTWNSRCG